MHPPILPISLTSGFSFDMLLVKGGSFRMGSEAEDANAWEKPAHPVKLSPFYIGKFPVTQALWKAVMDGEDNPSYFQGDQRPKTDVSWEDIDQLFLPKINDHIISEGLSFPKGTSLRLPTEAEWEFAALGGIHSKGFTYAGSNKLKEVGWFDHNSHSETKPVGLKFPNELGLYDMSGNVWEWCNDWYGIDYYAECLKKGPVENPLGPKTGASRVSCGGCFNIARNCRPSSLDYGSPGGRYNDLGFRLALSLQ